MRRTGFVRLAIFTTLLALAVVMLGAYVRLSDAGLGCPDWPGCYGQIAVPEGSAEISAANSTFPRRPVETVKAWKEMLHRYLAGTLGLVILGLATWAWRRRRVAGQRLAIPLLLVLLVIFQALLGMWTVTLLVKPAVVTTHLLGGVAIVALLWWLALRQGALFVMTASSHPDPLLPWVWTGVLLLTVQITLGGWTSTNYAALGCTEFPTCYGGQWFPPTDFREAFVIWRGLGVNYEYGVLDSAARTAIHISHRLGALIIALYLSWLAWSVLRRARPTGQRYAGRLLLLVLAIQLILGIGNVLGQLPLTVAVAHNGSAVILLLTLLTLTHTLSPPADWRNATPALKT